jgi:hypothetical protein
MRVTMTTEKQIAANRRNALKSTGPRTPEGKAKSALNGWKSTPAPDATPEQIAAFEDYRTGILDELEPGAGEERLIVDLVAVTGWAMRPEALCASYPADAARVHLRALELLTKHRAEY